jgi:DNA primase
MQDKSWVDFKVIKAVVTVEMLLARYNVNWLRRKDDELRGRCPIHQGEGTDTFHVSVSKNVFNCFSCKKRGNVLDFVAAMEKCSVRDAAVKIAEWFSVDGSDPKKGSERIEKSAPVVIETATENLTNKPLSFQLKGIDHEHAYLKARGLTPETIETFGVGFFSGKGSMSGRIVIPIHDDVGQLVAYAGRSVDGAEPKYKLPSGFHKSQVVYNLHRVNDVEVIVVEGFFGCMALWQSLNRSVVGLMGSSMSARQEELIVSKFRQVTLMLDGDDAGRKAAEEIAGRLVRKLYVRVVELPDGGQPDTLSADNLAGLLK